MFRLVSQGSNIFGQTSSFMVQNQSSGMFGVKSEASGFGFLCWESLIFFFFFLAALSWPA